MSTSKRNVCLHLPSDTADFLREYAYAKMKESDYGRYNINERLAWHRLARALQPADATQKGGHNGSQDK